MHIPSRSNERRDNQGVCTMKWIVLTLLFLISCAPAAQEVTTKPISEKGPAQAPTTQPVLEPQVKAPQEVVKAPETVKEEPKPQLSPQEDCQEMCKGSCEASAQNACTQPGRPECKAGCGDVIDPSACSQACTYVQNQPQQCKQMFEQFCSAQCVNYCH